MKHTCLRWLTVGLFACGTMLSARSLSAQTDYRIGAQDVLTITVFEEPTLTGKFTVEQDGTFTYPYIGRVKAGGLTLRDFEQELKKQLSPEYLKNPQVNVAIETYRSQRILVMGEVRSPSEYQLTGDMTLLSALLRAGGTLPSAGREVVIVRTPLHAPATGEPADSEIIKVDLAELSGGKMNIALQDRDTINIPKAQSVFVTGQVKSSGAYPVDRDTTLLQVLSLAGGVTDRGAEGRIKIQRIVNGKTVELKPKLTDIVQPGDTITVPERWF